MAVEMNLERCQLRVDRGGEKRIGSTGWAAGTNLRSGLPNGKPVAVTMR